MSIRSDGKLSLSSDGTVEIISNKNSRKSRPSIDYTPYHLNIGGKYNFALKLMLSFILVLILTSLIVLCVFAALGKAPHEPGEEKATTTAPSFQQVQQKIVGRPNADLLNSEEKLKNSGRENFKETKKKTV